MNIIQASNANVVRVAEYFLPKEITNQNLIIAGGFATWLLYLHKTVEDWDKFFADLDVSLINLEDKRLKDEATKGIAKFGDIDIWIPENHSLRKMKIITSQELYPFGLKENAGLVEKSLASEKSFEKSFGISSDLLKVSRFAHTYRLEHTVKLLGKIAVPSVFGLFEPIVIPYRKRIKMRNAFQIIRRTCDSLEEVFSTFDFHHTRAAYYNGLLHFTKKAERTFEEKTIFPTKSFLERHDSISINSACRAFKYMERYGFGFSEDLADKIADLYLQVGIAEDTADYVGPPKYAIINLFNATNLTPEYDPDYLIFFSEITPETLSKVKGIYLKRFLTSFKTFSRMSCFKDEYIGLLLCCDMEEISKVIERRLYEQSD